MILILLVYLLLFMPAVMKDDHVERSHARRLAHESQPRNLECAHMNPEKRVELGGGIDLEPMDDFIWSHLPPSAVHPCTIPLQSGR